MYYQSRFDCKKNYSSSTYYVAVRYNGWVWVCTNQPITYAKAKIVQLGNNPYVGIWATQQSGAKTLSAQT